MPDKGQLDHLDGARGAGRARAPGHRGAGLVAPGTARPRPGSICASVSLFFKGVKPKEVGAGCLFLINGHSDMGAGRDTRLNPPNGSA